MRGGPLSDQLLRKRYEQLLEENRQCQSQLKALIANAEENERLFSKLQKLITQLVSAQSPQETLQIMHDNLRKDFAVETLRLLSWRLPKKPLPYLTQLGIDENWMRLLKNTLRPGEPRCGQVTDTWQKGLFPGEDAVQSLCLLPLGVNKTWGALAIGSRGHRYDENQGTHFLQLLAQVLSLKLDPAFQNDPA